MLKYILQLFLFFPCLLTAQAILIDEDFSDWKDENIVHIDAENDNGSFIDFSKVWVTNSADRLFMSFEVGYEINLQDDNDITIYIDTDNNVNTGNGGAEFSFQFGSRRGQYFQNDIEHSDIELITAPTVTSTRFEFSINRGLDFDLGNLQMANTIRFFFKDERPSGDRIPNTGMLEYNFVDSNPVDLPNYSFDQVEKSDFRIISYNVERDNIFNSNVRNKFKRVIEALDPDIIGLQEVYDNNQNQVINILKEIDNDQTWYGAKLGPDIIFVSKYKVTALEEVRNNGVFLIEHPDQHMICIGAHLPCCDNNQARQQEADAIMALVREWKNGKNDPMTDNMPVILLGDMNLVGYAEQQITLIEGDINNESAFGTDFNPDWDNSAWEDAQPFTTGVPFKYTWFQRSSSFSPGRLDYLIYSGSVLNLENSFVLDTEFLTSSQLQDYGLNRFDSRDIADHIPIVTDFSFKPLVSKVENLNKPYSISVYPNPTNQDINIVIESDQKSLIKIDLFDLNGKFVKHIFQGDLPQFKIDTKQSTSQLSKGTYFLKGKVGQLLFSEKFIVQ